MGATLVIGSQYYGFPGVGFGGYVAGRLAELVGGAAQVTLRSPPPLERALAVEDGDGRLRLLDGDTLVAEAVPGGPDVEVPEPVSFDEATAASPGFVGFRRHPFPMCFCCGTARREGEGLHVFPGGLPGGGGVAAPWIPHPNFAGPDGTVRPEFVWSALDCPTYFGVLDGGDRVPGVEGDGDGNLALTTGRIHTAVLGPVVAGERHVVMGWPVSIDGRKHLGGAGVFTEGGELRAVSVATWLPLPKPAAPGP
ncbi:MAG: hypothetical protein WD770_10745 [Actinomycetota bacterium]